MSFKITCVHNVLKKGHSFTTVMGCFSPMDFNKNRKWSYVSLDGNVMTDYMKIFNKRTKCVHMIIIENDLRIMHST